MKNYLKEPKKLKNELSRKKDRRSEKNRRGRELKKK
jgi:hypothetical protein